MAWMDVTIGVIFIINGIKGWLRGFVLSLFDITGFIVSWMIAKSTYPLVAAYILDHTEILLTLQNVIKKRLESGSYAGASTNSPTTIIDFLMLPKPLKGLINSTTYGNTGLEMILNHVSQVVAMAFLNLICLVVIFFFVKLLFYWVGHLLNGIASLPILRGLNKFGGLFFGMVKGMFIVFIVFVILGFFAVLTNHGILMEGLENSVVAKFLYHHNPILSFLKGDMAIGDDFI